MCTRGILLVTDILDEHRNLTDLVSNGNPIIWGVLGWGVIFSLMIFVGYPFLKYTSKCLELRHKKAKCKSEKEKIRINLNRVELNMKKKKGEYRKKKRELERELKRILENELKRKEELKKISVLDFKKKKKMVKDIEELTEDKKDLEKEIGKLEEQMEVENEEYLRIYEMWQKKDEKCASQIEETEYRQGENKKILLNKLKRKKGVFLIGVLILLADGNNMIVTAQELKDTLVESLDSSKESQVDEPETEKPVSEDITMGNKEENIEPLFDIENDLREHMDYNFILEDEQLHKVLEDDIVDIIF